MQQSESAVEYSMIHLGTASCTLQLLQASPGPVHLGDYFDLVLLWFSQPNVEVGVLELTAASQRVPFATPHSYNFRTSYSLSVFALCFPLLWTIVDRTTSDFSIAVTQQPSVVRRIISYVLVEKLFIANNIFVVVDLLTEWRRHFILRRAFENYLNPTDANTLQGIMQLAYSGASITLPRLIVYDYMEPASTRPSTKVGFMATTSSIGTLQAAYLNFNPSYTSCPTSSFLAYSVPFSTMPESCLACPASCLTCTSSEEDSTYTDYRFCTSCVD